LDSQLPGGEEARLPDRPAADDQHPVVGDRLAAPDGMEAHGHWLHQGAEFLRHVFRQRHDVRGRNHNPVGESRRDLWRYAEDEPPSAPLFLT
jgi:hypothetical protein